MKYSSLLCLPFLLLAGCSMTPQPLTMQEIELRSTQDMEKVLAAQEPISGSINMYEAMARAMKYNMQSRLKLMEASLAVEQHRVTKFDLLPKMVASAGYNVRDNYSGSSSMALEGPNKGEESLISSTSQEKDYTSGDFSLMWNVLDFGLSYVRAKQEGDKVLIAQERKRKTVQNILQDVRSAYWKAVCAEAVLADLDRVMQQTKTALNRSRQVERSGLVAPRAALEYQRALLENVRFLKNLNQQMVQAKTELARLMNVRSAAQFHLHVPVQLKLPQLNLSLNSLETMALHYRPELREEDYRSRITSLETRKALLQVLPSINFQIGYNDNNNLFLHNQQWWDAGTQVSLNLFKLLSQPAVHRAVKTQQKVDNIRRQALSMAVVTQLHLAYNGFKQAKDNYELSQQLDRINSRLNELTLNEQQSSTGNELELIRSDTAALVSKMRKMLAYADVQQALSRIVNTLGLDILPDELDNASIKQVSVSLQQSVQGVEQWLVKEDR